ncbi:hypothetical protein POF50_019030 [Streptomyces sp. SL13]|uniref:Uncharacterized protein n=1 Tax=Streptantibioticus silvisoli TaxID=2705255 RepID=A0AA90H9M3_9ACTN|nr:hypothetical protein [Streptantibioticus silvisoli]MDI5971405.1 hypothetical protein [Streptantibioticus silvisoli]
MLLLPGPRLDRRALILILDAKKRLFLCGSCCRGWTPPEVRVQSGVDFFKATQSFLEESFDIRDHRYGDLYGHRWASTSGSWDTVRRVEMRVIIAKIDESQPHHLNGGLHVWWTLEELKMNHRKIYPEGVVLFVTGYLEGWLPAGPITLE